MIVFIVMGVIVLVVVIAVTLISQPPERLAKKLTGVKKDE